MELGADIRNLRKRHGMTRETLAQAMNVTAGTVCKWETDKRVPDILIIVEMTDLFGESVDYCFIV